MITIPAGILSSREASRKRHIFHSFTDISLQSG
jgi:hypothetical protein